MRIAICDDDIKFVENLKLKLYDYSNSHNLEPVIDSYYSGEELINCKTKYDLIILDYKMGELSGIDTAKELRKGKNKFSCIIFLTSFPEVTIPAYDVDTYRFVVKDFMFDSLYKALDSFRNNQKYDYDISVKLKNELITINTENIIYFESQNKNVIIYLTNGENINIKIKLSLLYKKVPNTHFIQIHKSYIINMNHIQIIHPTSIKMRGIELTVPISRNFKNVFLTKYNNYLLDRKI